MTGPFFAPEDDAPSDFTEASSSSSGPGAPGFDAAGFATTPPDDPEDGPPLDPFGDGLHPNAPFPVSDSMGERLLGELALRYAVALDGGEWRVHYEDEVPGIGRVWTTMSEQAFAKRWPHRFGASTLGKVFLHRAPRLDRVICHPRPSELDAGIRQSSLNLWGGFAVAPAGPEARCDRLLAHLYHVIANGDDAVYHYVLCWCAYLVQCPEQRHRTALVLQGGKGTGKSLLGRVLADLVGRRHAAVLSNTYHLTGHFNAILRDKVLVVADEAFWAGDRASENVLKALVTDPTLTLEGKGKDAVVVPNMLSFLMTSNADWVVPASMDDRRWAVLEVAGDKAGDRAYFDGLHAEVEAGGLGALLRELLALDLTGWSPEFDRPKTAALLAQAQHSLPPLERWWTDRLRDGLVFTRTRANVAEAVLADTDGWAEGCVVPAAVLLDEVLADLDFHRVGGFDRSRATATALGGFLRKVLGADLRKVRRSVGMGTRREWAYELPALAVCRARYARGNTTIADWLAGVDEDTSAAPDGPPF